MNEISPTYYAQLDNEKASFNIVGEGFQLIPSDAVGILATNNANPLQQKDSQSGFFVLKITNKTELSMRIEMNAPHDMGDPVYLGGIVSADRQTVYWVNDTQPIP